MKKNQENDVEEGAAWMTTYSDMVTLLFTFFVLMFAISAVDDEKFKLFVAAFQSSGGLTDEEWVALKVSDEKADEDLGIDSVPEDPTEPENSGLLQPVEPDEEEPAPEENMDLEQLNTVLSGYLFENGLEHSVYVHPGEGDGDQLMMTLTGDVWFTPGSADVSPEMKGVAVEIARMISSLYNPEYPFRIVVSGHTDNVPQNSAQYPSNWHLSGMRASNFLLILINESDIPADRFYSQAQGEEKPIASNDTEEGRRLNRRVEILISQHKAKAQP